MRRITLIVIVGTLGVFTSCSSDDATSTPTPPAASTPASVAVGATGAFATISAQEASTVIGQAPADLVVLDVRTPEEYAEGHLDGAVLVDFYEPDFADQLSRLDLGVPYLVYCQSGNRSGQTLTMMQQLDFASAVDINGGIVAWQASGLPVVTQ